MTLIVAIALSVIVILAMAYDVTRFIIPNWLNAALILLYPVWVILAPQPIDWVNGLLFGFVVLIAGFGLYAIKMLGAGDVKFLAGCGLYCGLNMTGAALIFYMALLGGLIAMFLLASRVILRSAFKGRTLPRVFTVGAPVPYGLAIAGSFLILLWLGRLPGMTVSQLNIF